MNLETIKAAHRKLLSKRPMDVGRIEMLEFIQDFFYQLIVRVEELEKSRDKALADAVSWLNKYLGERQRCVNKVRDFGESYPDIELIVKEIQQEDE